MEMSGTRPGGLKAAAKNKQREPGFYQRIGAIGGRKGTTGGFAANRELARTAGRKGGLISRRGKACKDNQDLGASSSTTSTSNFGTCADCGKARVIGAPAGTCQCPDWKPF